MAPPIDPSSVEAVIHGAEVAGAGLVGKGGLKRLLGPSTDEIANAMARWTAFRVGNVKRIGEAADKKAGERDGEVHPRVVHRLLEEGSYCDDALMADYLGGLLAGSRSPDGRDDRAVAWSDLVTGLSALQIRAHYLIYRELADSALHERSDVRLSMADGRRQATLVMEYIPFLVALTQTSGVHGAGDEVTHAVAGLVRAGLIESTFAYGEGAQIAGMMGIPAESVQGRGPVVVVQPSFAGIELWGWAQGLSGMNPAQFPFLAQPFEIDPPVPRVASHLPLLPELPTAEIPTS